MFIKNEMVMKPPYSSQKKMLLPNMCVSNVYYNYLYVQFPSSSIGPITFIKIYFIHRHRHFTPPTRFWCSSHFFFLTDSTPICLPFFFNLRTPFEKTVATIDIFILNICLISVFRLLSNNIILRYLRLCLIFISINLFCSC